MTNNRKSAIAKMLQTYFIAGTQDILQGTLPDILERALKAGITCFQYREKGAGSLKTKAEKHYMAQVCQRLCQQYQVPFFIDDDVELALKIAADGIHVGQNDLEIAKVIHLSPRKMLIGLSCHSEAEVLKANSLREIAYLGIGPVFGTVSKADAESPIDLPGLQKLVRQALPPVVAIGGINEINAAALSQTGIAGVAIISAITRSGNITQTVAQIKKSFAKQR